MKEILAVIAAVMPSIIILFISWMHYRERQQWRGVVALKQQVIEKQSAIIKEHMAWQFNALSFLAMLSTTGPEPYRTLAGELVPEGVEVKLHGVPQTKPPTTH